MSTDAYIDKVVARLPRTGALRTHVAMEVRSHIAERLDHGQTVDEALRQLALLAVGFCLYTVVAEYRFGETIGKRLVGLRVVRESGGGISLGQSIVRQLPVFLQAGWIDIFFALFTERRQRAFEILSKTRVVRAVAEDES